MQAGNLGCIYHWFGLLTRVIKFHLSMRSVCADRQWATIMNTHSIEKLCMGQSYCTVISCFSNYLTTNENTIHGYHCIELWISVQLSLDESLYYTNLHACTCHQVVVVVVRGVRTKIWFKGGGLAWEAANQLIIHTWSVDNFLFFSRQGALL